MCGWFLERVSGTLWSYLAGRPNPDAWHRVPGAKPVTYKTRDGRTLHGYTISPDQPPLTPGQSTGFVLFAQGNAMLADQLLDALSLFARQGIHVFVYDYRGYGRSEGKPRLKAIVSDYEEIFQSLSATHTGRKLLYGISFGGLVVLNVIGRGAAFDGAVIDSTPSRVSTMGCPEDYDPVRNVPENAANILIISGRQDSVVRPAEQSELLGSARARRARVVIEDEFGHPFMDRKPSIHTRRLELVKSFLFGPGR